MTFLKKTYIFFQQACTHEKINQKDPSSPIYEKNYGEQLDAGHNLTVKILKNEQKKIKVYIKSNKIFAEKFIKKKRISTITFYT